MARGTAFSELFTRLRAETGRSTSVAVGVDDLDQLKEVLNSTYQTLYMNHDWAHLMKVFPRVTLNAGQRYYNFPTGLNSERVTRVVVWRDGIASDITRGIGPEEYNTYAPSLATQTLRIIVQSVSDYPPIEFPAPEGGWTHQQLCDLHLGLPERACADAYLGMEWIGSTEV